jgi:AcrR family transcriptional regulator
MASDARGARGNPDETRRRVLDAAIATVIDVGYYKASSNEIARRAGVTWGTIQHLFGSREMLMVEVVNDLGARLEQQLASAPIDGETLEDRLWNVLKALSGHYEQDEYLVQMQILLDLSANPKTPAPTKRALRRSNSRAFDDMTQPLLSRALGDVAAEKDLVLYAFMTFRGYLAGCAVARRVTEFPKDLITRLVIVEGGPNESVLRDLLVRGVATTIREEAERRGYDLA